MMLCLDTYALIEINDQNKNYSSIQGEDFCIPDVIMAEFYGILLRDYDKRTADYWLRKLRPICRMVSLDILVEASEYRSVHKKEKLSFFDCVGYIFALKNKMQFVTGDKAFKRKKGVLFIQ